MKNILIIYSDPKCSCTRKSTFELGKALSKHTSVTIKIHTDITDQDFKHHDVIIIQRLGANGAILSDYYKSYIFSAIERFKQENKFIIYNIDDLIFSRQDSCPTEFMKRVDAVLVPNENFTKHILPYNQKILFTRTFIDKDHFDTIKSDKKLDKSKFNILWASTGSLGKKFMYNLMPELKKQIPEAIVHCLGNLNFAEFSNCKVAPIQPFNDFIKYIKACDVLINPADSDLDPIFITKNKLSISSKDFIDCKSEIKYLNAGLCKKPIISSKTASYCYAIKHMINGILLDNDVNQWISILKKLRINTKLRKSLVGNAFKDVITNYTLEVTGKRIYKSIEEAFYSKFQPKIIAGIHQPMTSGILGEITPNRKIIQFFKSDKNNLFEIHVFAATYARINTSNISLSLFEKSTYNKTPVRRVLLNTYKLSDNDWMEFTFDPITNSFNKEYYMVIETLDGRGGNTITCYYAPKHGVQPEIGDLLFNNYKTTNCLSFRTFHKVREHIL